MPFFKGKKAVFVKAAALSTALLLYCTTLFSCASVIAKPEEERSTLPQSQLSLIQTNAAPMPSVSAKSAVLIDADSGAILCQKDADMKLPMASTTKIMTALVAIENCDIEKEISIPAGAVGVEGSSVYLYEGEKLTLKDLLYAMMLESANDAAAAIAIQVGGSIEGFARMMNAKAESLGLGNTHFENPHGLDGEDHYTTAHELAKIAACAMKNDVFCQIVATRKKTIPLNGTEGVRLLINHNKLLKNYDGAIGIKTGYTKKSGRCLVSAAERDGLRLICVTLSAPDDWRDHKTILDYGFSLYESRLLYEKGEFKHTLPIVGGEGEYVTLTNREEIRVTLPRSASAIEYSVETRGFEYAPVTEGAVLGSLQCKSDGVTVMEAPLYASYSVSKAKQRSLWESFTSLFKK
jgi:D-alanyl-D-alanine carboxypeptidase